MLILIVILILSIIYIKTKTKTNTILSAKYIESDISLAERLVEIKSDEENNIEPEYAEGQAIIITNNNSKTYSAKSTANSILSELKIEKLAEIKSENSKSLMNLSSTQNFNNITISLVTSDEYTTEDLIKKLEDEGIYAEPNYIMHTTAITNDSYISHQWAIENNGQNSGKEGADINPISTTSTEEKVIAVVDTGVDYTHSDLKNVMWKNPYKDSTDLPGEYGYDFGESDTNPMDNNGHGTHCAGIIGAQSNNGNGITGAVLDNSNIKIMALKIENSKGELTYDASIKAYEYIRDAIDKGINVVAINNSWGGYASSGYEALKVLIDEVGEKGALSICAAGNDSINTDNKTHLPSGIESDYIVSVAASNVSDELSNFSNYGSATVDIAAPGSDILSTVSKNVFNPSIYTDIQRNNLCNTYKDFDSGSLVQNTDYKVTEGTVTLSDEEYFGNSGKSAKWTIENATKGEKYYIYFPCTINTARNLF